MITYKLQKEVSEILSSFEKNSIFLSGLNEIGNTFSRVEDILLLIGMGGNKFNEAANALGGNFVKLSSVISTINPRKFYFSLEKFQTNISNTIKSEVNDYEILDGIAEAVEIFSDKFDAYLSSQNQKNAITLVIEARKLISLLDGFHSALLFINGNLEQRQYNLQSGGEISIFLSSSINLRQFAEKLQAIDLIYKEICFLLNISVADEPLQIGKVESGSLWAKLFGNSRAISMTADFIEASASYVYRNFSKEGKLSGIPRKIETVDEILGLYKRLQVEGIDIKEMKESISKSAISIAKEVNVLLDGQAEIKVNENKYSVGDEVQKQLLQASTTLHLESDGIQRESNLRAIAMVNNENQVSSGVISPERLE